MGLQVWLPLNGNLENKGLSNTTFINNGAVLNDNGKIGKGYSFSPAALSSPNFTLLNNISTFSVCLWVKFTSFPAQSNGYCVTLNGASSSDEHFMIGIMSTDGVTAQFRLNLIDNPSYTLQKNIWYHLGVCVNNNVAYMYVNGDLIKTINNFTIPNILATNLVIGGRSNNTDGTKFTGQNAYGIYNDVRIYDHCLSPKEIKEISKGLVLHYPLKDNIQILNNCYSYPTFNTSTSSGGWSHWGRTGAVGTFSQSTDSNYIYKNNNSSYAHKVSNGASATGEYLLYQSPAFEGGYRSLQAIIKEENSSPINEEICFPAWNANTSKGAPLGVWSSITNLGNGFYLCKVDGLNQDGSSDLVGIYVKPGKTIYVTCCYLENDRTMCSDIFNTDTSIVEDCSGYGYHGTAVGNIIPEKNSPRYLSSYHFNGTEYIKVPNFNYNINHWSVSLWYYYTQAPTGYQSLLCLTKGDGSDPNKKFGIHPNSSYIWFKLEQATYTLNSLKFNSWTHIVITSDGTYGKIYENGILKATVSITSNLTNYTDLVIGARSSSSGIESVAVNAICSLSDVRVYSTALSDQDIKELYDTSASIDKNGNLYCREIVEV